MDVLYTEIMLVCGVLSTMWRFDPQNSLCVSSVFSHHFKDFKDASFLCQEDEDQALGCEKSRVPTQAMYDARITRSPGQPNSMKFLIQVVTQNL